MTEQFPGLDCGSCGAPSCHALAEDIVRGEASEHDCIHKLKEDIHTLSLQYKELAKEAMEADATSNDCIYMLQSYIDRITKEIALLDAGTKNMDDAPETFLLPPLTGQPIMDKISAQWSHHHSADKAAEKNSDSASKN